MAKSHRLRFLALFIAACGLLLLPEIIRAFTQPADKAWGRVEQSGAIRFAINPTAMPFDGLGDHGDFFGLDVDIAHELARRLGRRAEFVIAGYDSLYDVLRVGQAEATISALPIDPGQLALWAYSEPYFEAGQVMVSRLPKSEKTSEVSIAVEYGSDADAAARRLARRRADVEIKYTSSAAEALKAVTTDAADAAIVDGVSAKQLSPKFPELQIVEQVTNEPYAIAVWGESTQLLAALNAKLAEMKQDGTVQRIIDEWMRK
ncbi:MAG TPA: transporter substrate-binding domain-containing protein [Anaerolineae bacterium]|nr:transporter substrate-binding domain-containing protein [Anaerolineae bacterium]